jgi:hypothetical protein
VKRTILILAVALGAGWSTVAFAAGLPLVPGSVGAGSAAVVPCDSDGFALSYATSGGNVVSATVAGIDAGCAGGSLSLVLVVGSGARIASGGPLTVPATGSVTANLAPQPAADAVAGYRVTIAGP